LSVLECGGMCLFISYCRRLIVPPRAPPDIYNMMAEGVQVWPVLRILEVIILVLPRVDYCAALQAGIIHNHIQSASSPTPSQAKKLMKSEVRVSQR